MGGQLVEFSIYNNEPHLYVGRVLTFLTGPGKHVSGHVVAYTQAALNDGTLLTWPSGIYAGQPIWKLQVAAEKWSIEGPDRLPGKANVDDDTDGTVDNQPVELGWPNTDDLQAAIYMPGSPNPQSAGDDFVINGMPFSGTGVGYDDTAANDGPWLTKTDNTGLEFALRPNPTAPTFMGGISLRELAGHLDSGDAPVNEDYDALDYQNMSLALVAPYDSGMAGIDRWRGTHPVVPSTGADQLLV